jgi:hypothetical protein
MENIEISADGLIEFKHTEKMIYASDSERQKKLFVTLSGNYEVWHKGELIRETDGVLSAVIVYNGLLTTLNS